MQLRKKSISSAVAVERFFRADSLIVAMNIPGIVKPYSGDSFVKSLKANKALGCK